MYSSKQDVYLKIALLYIKNGNPLFMYQTLNHYISHLYPLHQLPTSITLMEIEGK